MIRGRYLPRLNRDETLVIAASAVRAMDYGFLAVFLGVYLGLLGYTVFEAGLVFSSIMAGGALSNIVVAWRGDAIGRKRMLVFMSGLMVLGGVLYPFVTASWLLVLIGLFAMTSSTGGDRTAFLSVDMAILSQTSSVSRRTVVFGWYDVIGLGAKALGTLLIAVPPLLQSQLDMGEIASFKAMFGVYCVIAFAGMLLYGQLSPHAEATQPDDPSDRRMSKGSRNLILRLTALFSLDAMGGGFMVRGFISYWFVSRFGISPTSVAGIFFTGQMLTAVSVMLAASVASRIGLINTVVLTQFVSKPLHGCDGTNRQLVGRHCHVLGERASQRHGRPYQAVLYDGNRATGGQDRDRRSNKPGPQPRPDGQSGRRRIRRADHLPGSPASNREWDKAGV